MSNIDISIKGIIGIAIPLTALYFIKTIGDVARRYLDIMAAQSRAKDDVAETIPETTEPTTPLQRVNSSTNTSSAKNSLSTNIIPDYAKK